MNEGVMSEEAVRRIARRFWDELSDNPLVSCYIEDHGQAFDDFCTDLSDLVAIIYETHGELDRMDKILARVWEDSNAILSLFEAEHARDELWPHLLELALFVDAEIETLSWVCPGCQQSIAEGQHYMVATLRLESRMPSGYQPVVEVPPTLLSARVHDPGCATVWMAENDILTNVFAP